jgi:hypothetical protein
MLEINIKFTGSYYLLKWILKKYKHELPYIGQVTEFAIKNNYSKRVIHHWSYYGVGYRVWNCLHKDLFIIFLMGKIQYEGLEQLKKDYEIWKKS